MRTTALSCLVLLLVACDGSSGGDAGPPDAPLPAIVLTVNTASLVDTIPGRGGGAIGPTAGEKFYLLDITLDANDEDMLPVAPVAFTLTLDDDSTVMADADGTNNTADGCDSRSVPRGESTTCNVAFEVGATPPPPRSLTWSNLGSLSVRAPVPPPS